MSFPIYFLGKVSETDCEDSAYVYLSIKIVKKIYTQYSFGELLGGRSVLRAENKEGYKVNKQGN